MLAAAFFSLLNPAIELVHTLKLNIWVHIIGGFTFGCLLIFGSNYTTRASAEYFDNSSPRQHIYYVSRRYVKFKYISKKFEVGDVVLYYKTDKAIKSKTIRRLESCHPAVITSIDNQMPEDFLTIDMMSAYESLGKIIGEEVEEDPFKGKEEIKLEIVDGVINTTIYQK